ncbi:MBL fold metallo-hydrolase [Salipaludibacillus sp. CUR1]|uniref:MBL fold metallo-hydrolase n=1 Tax=Salipaludibacillus sp. CUR1 TaxID=2820003 RepID=UPI001E5A7340|nr:MBL fold metallo-hydrolase [Salipaludibacillus sp. CUR1]MCE7792914.1 MBL fold metallo-hydrolase [Salipaludibacillus sp. CUR1]
MRNRLMMMVLSVITLVTFTACAENEEQANQDVPDEQNESNFEAENNNEPEEALNEENTTGNEAANNNEAENNAVNEAEENEEEAEESASETNEAADENEETNEETNETNSAENDSESGNNNPSENDNNNTEESEEFTELEELAVHFIDVGQADATLFKYSYEGERYKVLFDTGNWNRNDVANYLNDQGISSIDIMIGSHPHADHIGQMDTIINEFDVSEVWMSGDTTTSQTFQRVMDAIEESDADYYEPRTGDIFDVGPLEITIINPDSLTGDVHEGSISAVFKYGETSFILTGDAEEQTEQAMVDRGFDLDSDVLQVGHHGSSTSTIQPFLDAVAPDIAIISAGENNQYGHPHDEVVERILTADVDLYGTYVHGTIIVESDGESLNVLTKEDGTVTPPSTGQTAPSDSANDSETNAENETTETEEESSEPTDGACIDINSASQSELEEIIHIGPARAEELIDLRPFGSLDDLTRVSGIAEGRLTDIKDEGKACAR